MFSARNCCHKSLFNSKCSTILLVSRSDPQRAAASAAPRVPSQSHFSLSNQEFLWHDCVLIAESRIRSLGRPRQARFECLRVDCALAEKQEVKVRAGVAVCGTVVTHEKNSQPAALLRTGRCADSVVPSHLVTEASRRVRKAFRHDTDCRADDGSHDGHLADVERPRQPCAAAGRVVSAARWSGAIVSAV